MTDKFNFNGRLTDVRPNISPVKEQNDVEVGKFGLNANGSIVDVRPKHSPVKDQQDVEVGKFGVHKLPPCKVCGAQATGYHYGANTCEACKGFYHRSLSKKDTYICLKNAKCDLKPGNRSLCPYCRYQRCVEIGMSKKGIKTGRYSYAKRTQDILEIQGYQRAQSVESDVSRLSNSPSAEGAENTYFTEKDEEIEHLLSTLREARNNFVLAQLANSRQLQAQLQIANLPNLNPQLIASISQPPDVGINFHAFKPPVNSNEFIRAPSAEEVSSAAAIHWAKAIGSRSGGLRNIIDFIKCIPGFKSLSVSDQIQLIKYSMAEIWIIGKHATFNIETKQFTSSHGLTFDLGSALGEEIADVMCRVANRLQRLALGQEELILLTAFVVMYTDRCCLADNATAEQIQDRLLDALLYVLRRKYGVARHLTIFSRIVSVLTELRHVTHLYLNMTNRLVTSTSDLPPLLAEILTLT